MVTIFLIKYYRIKLFVLQIIAVFIYVIIILKILTQRYWKLIIGSINIKTQNWGFGVKKSFYTSFFLLKNHDNWIIVDLYIAFIGGSALKVYYHVIFLDSVIHLKL